MDPVSSASGIAGLIAVAVKTIELVGEYVMIVHEHKKHVETLRKELELMKEVLEKLNEVIIGEKHSGEMTGVDGEDRNTVLGKAFSDCTNTIEQIQGKLKEPLGRLQKAMAKLKWPFEQKDVLRMVDKLRRYTQLFQLSLTAGNRQLLSKTFDAASEGLKLQRDSCKNMQKLWEGFPDMAKTAEKTLEQTETLLELVPTFLHEFSLDMKEIEFAQKEAERREQERRRTEILDWLHPLSGLQKHSDIQARRAQGTGNWFLELDQVATWMSAESDSHEVLCLGDPGVGKTNLTSLVIDQLRDLHKDADVAIVHYYCDYREQQAQTPTHCARSMLRQLTMQCIAVPACVSEFYDDTCNEVKGHSWYKELQKILCRVASTFSTCLFIVDALDEVEPRFNMPGLLNLLALLRNGMKGRAPKIFATSRKHASLVLEAFPDATKLFVSANNDDLRTILAKIILDHRESKYILDENLKRDILDKLCTNAHGMFLLPILQIQYILSQLTKSEVRRALSDLSPTLPEVFQSTIDRIKALPADPRHAMNRQNLAKNTLMWISHAKRVLTVAELQHVLAIRLNESDLDRENFIEPQLVVDSCFGLVEIDKESSTIRFVHYSLQEFLKSHKHGLFENGDMEITKVCLRYMSLDSVKDLHVKNRRTFMHALQDFAFLDYAATEWGCHASDLNPEDVKDLALKFLRSHSHLLTIARVRDHQSPYFRKWYERMWQWAISDGAGISLCATFGLTKFLKLLIGESRQPMVMAKNMYGSTPLHEAAIKGYEATAQLLLDYGADVLDLNLGSSTPLFLAVANGHVPMAQLLLQNKPIAQLDLRGREGWTVLHKASHMGDEEMVTLLLQTGAMVNAEDYKGMRPLHLAAQGGYIEVVRLLLLSHADVYATTTDQFTSLDHAVRNGHLEVSKMLLDEGAQINHCAQDSWTALLRAARSGYEHIVALLLDRGADILTEDHKGEIPLHAAARSGNIRVAQLLLNTKSDLRKEQLSKRDRKGSTPKDVAFFTAHFDMHKYLRAAETENQGHSLTTIDMLTTAIEAGKLEKVRRLLANESIDIDALLDGSQPALHLALQEQQIEMVKVLLQHGAKIDSIGYHGWTPLHIAAAIGNLELTKLCLSHGANIQAVTYTAQTALHKACSSKSVQVVKELLEAGADKEAENERGMRPIHIAACQNNVDMLRLLVLDYGANISAKDKFGATAATWADRSGRSETLQFLKSVVKEWKRTKNVALLELN